MKKTLPRLIPYDIDCLNKCRQIIDNDLSARHTVASLASLAGMSTTKFKSCFKNYFGFNVFEYAQMQRMNHAYKLVTENYHSIKTIAMLCGYVHASHFYTAFKKTFGISARKMRLQLNHSNGQVVLKKTNGV